MFRDGLTVKQKRCRQAIECSLNTKIHTDMEILKLSYQDLSHSAICPSVIKINSLKTHCICDI